MGVKITTDCVERGGERKGRGDICDLITRVERRLTLIICNCLPPSNRDDRCQGRMTQLDG